MSKGISLENAHIFRITHRSNLRWIFANGLHCANSGIRDPEFVPIGNADLIERRRLKRLPMPYGGALSDYVPFYFTPFSPMMYNIKTGYAGITKRDNEDIVILVSAIPRLEELGIKYVFSDRHALLEAAQFSSDVGDLTRIDWALLRRRDFQRDPNDPAKVERYQAEALVYEHVPLTALLGVACYSEGVLQSINQELDLANIALPAAVKREWYFQ